MTKNLLSIFGLGLALTASSVFAASVPLTPGTSIPDPGVTSNGATFPGSLVASLSGVNLVNSLNSAESATLSEDVYRTTGGTLDFFYQLTNTSSGGDALNTVAVRNFTGFTTAVSYVTSSGTIAPTNAVGGAQASRSTTGDTVNFFFQANGGDGQFPAGATTYWLEVDTNATTYNMLGTAGVIDGGTAQVGSIYGPASTTPEPMTMTLLGSGLALLGASRLRRGKKS